MAIKEKNKLKNKKGSFDIPAEMWLLIILFMMLFIFLTVYLLRYLTT